MTEVPQILCAVDLSQAARAAFTQALALSCKRSAALTVVHAVPMDRPFGWRVHERIEMIADLHRAADDAGVPLRVSVQQGEPVGVILLHANARPFDFLVLGTHQRTGWGRFRAGSVAEAVVQRAACPALVGTAICGRR